MKGSPFLVREHGHNFEEKPRGAGKCEECPWQTIFQLLLAGRVFLR
jgi:hypothetical protein